MTDDIPPYQLAIVAPCYNEEEGILKFYQELTEILDDLTDFEATICLVDDGSSDSTPDLLRKLSEDDSRVRAIILSRNFGHQIALTAGVNSCDSDVVITMDSDLQHPPELIPALIERWREGYEVVSAVREDTQGVSGLKKRTSGLFYSMINLLSDTYIPPGTADFNLLSRKAREALMQMPEKHRFLRGMVAWTGYRRAFVPYVAPPRFAGESKYSWGKMIKLALTATVSFSTLPLTLAVRFGFLVAFTGFAYLLYAIGRYFIVQDTVSGWASLLGTTLIMGGIQLIFIGVIGKYLAMVFEEVKQRPLYFVQYDSANRSERSIVSSAKQEGIPS